MSVTTSRLSRSIPMTRSISTRAFFWRDRMARIGRCDLRRGQDGRRHLIEKGLEQMVVAPVDHDHLDRRVAQLQGSVEAAESGADNDHPGLR